MNHKLSHLFVVLILSGALFGCKTPQASDESVIYRNVEYGFTFSLPSDWRGYSVSIQQLEDERYSPAEDKQMIVGHTPMITLRHPQWRANTPYQDIPILVFARSQWDLLHQGKLWPSFFAGGTMDELWHNQKFVFAMSSRYNTDDELNGWNEAKNIIQQNCAAHQIARLYPE